MQAKARADIQTKLTDQKYITSAVLEGRLSPQELQELVEDMKAGGFTPSLPQSDDEEDEDETEGAVEEDRQEEPRKASGDASILGLPTFDGQANVSAGGVLPNFGDQKA